MLYRKQIWKRFFSVLLILFLFAAQTFPVQAEERGLSDDERKLISLAAEDLGAAVRYYHENMIYPGVCGTYIFGEKEGSEPELLSGEALISFEKNKSRQAEDQLFTMFIYTDRDKGYTVKIPTGVRSVYTAAELLDQVPENERIVFAVLHFNSYEYKDEKVSVRLRACSEGFVTVNGGKYYIKSDGTVLTQSATINGIRWKFGENGVCQGKYTGFTKSSKGRRYWKNGALQKNRTVTLKNGTVYRADEKGYLTAG